MPKAIYKNLCPACHGFISSELLSKGSTCSICSKKVNINYLDINRQELIEINNYFTKLLGAEMWSAQRMWAKRILRGQSFSMIAPTGSGKTVFGIIMSIYMAHTRKWKTLFILPTSILVEQVYDKTVSFISKFSLKTNVVAYHTFLSKKEKEKV
ncbi:MAG TPA: DEAD/DEAH box helicase, partial [Thermofilum sp.]|nr:DEAD/DEAH box helicase [Thermofilum sp.]